MSKKILGAVLLLGGLGLSWVTFTGDYSLLLRAGSVVVALIGLFLVMKKKSSSPMSMPPPQTPPQMPPQTPPTQM